MSDLFPDVKEILSPRLQWLQEHDVSTRLDVGGRWMAFTGKEAQSSAEESKKMIDSQLCFATTEEDAIERLAQRNGWKLWNEFVS
jgi:hypothetical protein